VDRRVGLIGWWLGGPSLSVITDGHPRTESPEYWHHDHHGHHFWKLERRQPLPSGHPMTRSDLARGHLVPSNAVGSRHPEEVMHLFDVVGAQRRRLRARPASVRTSCPSPGSSPGSPGSQINVFLLMGVIHTPPRSAVTDAAPNFSQTGAWTACRLSCPFRLVEF